MARMAQKSEAPAAMPRLEILSRCPVQSILWLASQKHYKNKSHRDTHFQNKWEEKTIQKYKIIYADPPWQYAQKGVHGLAENHTWMGCVGK